MARALLFLPHLLSLIVSVRAIATCYYPDGVTKEPGHVPCNQTSASPSACCDPKDSCSTSGICLGRSGWTYRGSCTDASWESSNCAATEWPQCLTDPSTQKKYNGWTAIWSCASPGTGGSSYCCAQGDSTSSCCADDFTLGVTGSAFKPGYDQFLINITEAATAAAEANNTSSTTNTASSSSSSSSSASASNTSSAPAQTTSSSSSSSSSPQSSDLGTKIGLGVGIPLGVLVAGILSLLFYREYSKRRGYGATGPYNGGNSMDGTPSPLVSQAPMEQNTAYAATPTQQPAYSPNPPKVNPYNPAPVYEAPPSNNVHEMRA